MVALACCLCCSKKLAKTAGDKVTSNMDKREVDGSSAQTDLKSATNTSKGLIANVNEMRSHFMTKAVPKAKMVLSHQQVLQGLSGIYAVTWPADFSGLLDILQIFAYVDIFKIIPGIECAFSTNFIGKLVIRTMLPLLLVAIFLLVGRRLNKKGDEKKKRTGDFLTNFGLLVVFLSYPGVTSAVFRFFQTKSFDLDCTTGGVVHQCTYLASDLSIETSSSTYTGMVWFAWLMIIIWPIGVPLLISVLMWSNRAKLLELKRREHILETGAYDSERWAASLAERKKLGVPINPKDEAPEPKIEGYLAKFTKKYGPSDPPATDCPQFA